MYRLDIASCECATSRKGSLPRRLSVCCEHKRCSWIGHGSKSQRTLSLILSSNDLVYMLHACGDGDWIVTAAHARWEMIFWQDRRSAPAASRAIFAATTTCNGGNTAVLTVRITHSGYQAYRQVASYGCNINCSQRCGPQGG
jgi:hypothetical protein